MGRGASRDDHLARCPRWFVRRCPRLSDKVRCFSFVASWGDSTRDSHPASPARCSAGQRPRPGGSAPRATPTPDGSTRSSPTPNGDPPFLVLFDPDAEIVLDAY